MKEVGDFNYETSRHWERKWKKTVDTEQTSTLLIKKINIVKEVVLLKTIISRLNEIFFKFQMKNIQN